MAERVDHKTKVQELYISKYKPLGLAPAHVTGLKAEMMKASKKHGGDTKAITSAVKAWMKEKGISTTEHKGKKARSVSAKVAPKDKKLDLPRKADPGVVSPVVKILKQSAGGNAALKNDILKGVPKGNIDMTKLDRKTMKGMAADLNVTVKKSMSDDELRTALTKAMVGIDKTVEKQLDKLNPGKVSEGLKDCLGLFIDLTKATCIACPLQGTCRDLFEQHRQGGFQVFEQLSGHDVKVEPLVELDDAPDEVVEEPKKKKSKLKVFNPSRKIEVYDIGLIKNLKEPVEVDGVTITDHLEHKKMLKQVMAEVPKNLGLLGMIVLKHMEPDDDTDEAKHTLITFFATYFEKLGLIELI